MFQHKVGNPSRSLRLRDDHQDHDRRNTHGRHIDHQYSKEGKPLFSGRPEKIEDRSHVNLSGTEKFTQRDGNAQSQNQNSKKSPLPCERLFLTSDGSDGGASSEAASAPCHIRTFSH